MKAGVGCFAKDRKKNFLDHELYLLCHKTYQICYINKVDMTHP